MESDSEPYAWLDVIIGLIYLACFLWGTTTNLISLYYFIKQRFKKTDLTSHLYTLTALQDIIISLLSLNHGMNMLRQRDVWLPRFCSVQHILFQMSQRMSVFLVAYLSVTRTYTLCFPLRSLNTKYVLLSLAGLWSLMTCFFIIPVISGITQMTYHKEGGYCWVEPIPGKSITNTWDEVDNIMDTIGLACPVIPITISAVISSYKIMGKTKGTQGVEIPTEIVKIGNRMTFTIILVTILYIISNIPLFINYLLYVITIEAFSYPGPIYSSVVMYYYSWNVTALLSTALNASANPVVYYIRMDKLQTWLKGGCKDADLGPEQVNSHESSQRPDNNMIKLGVLTASTSSRSVTSGKTTRNPGTGIRV